MDDIDGKEEKERERGSVEMRERGEYERGKEEEER